MDVTEISALRGLDVGVALGAIVPSETEVLLLRSGSSLDATRTRRRNAPGAPSVAATVIDAASPGADDDPSAVIDTGHLRVPLATDGFDSPRAPSSCTVLV